MSAAEIDGRHDPTVARLLSERVSRTLGVVAYGLEGDTLLVASSSTSAEVAERVAQSVPGYEIRLVEASQVIVDALLDEAYPAADAPELVALASRPDQPRVGELLLELGVASDEEIQGALAEQQRTGDRLGDILVHSGVITEAEMLAVLSEHFDVQHVDLTGFQADPEIATSLPESFSRDSGIVPVAKSGSTLFVAVAERLSPALHAELEAQTGGQVRELLATRTAITELMQRVHGERDMHDATYTLMELAPQNSAHRVLSSAQKVAMWGLIALTLVALVLATVTTLIVITGLCSIFYLAVSLYRFRLAYLALGHKLEITVTDEEIAALDERDLPVYTLLLPLYKEASIVGRLAAGLDALDYPKTKLDIKLLCEEDDTETIDAIRALQLPPHYQLLVVPDSLPKTKPKACNYGLLFARGQYCVIYDGEDRPDPDQLKKAIVAFRKSPDDLACIQAKLNYFNRDQNLLTKWFSIEYAMHFDLVLPGLDQDGVPIPLGGTSNHFVTSRLRELGAWDPFNVTEDADLGVRLHKAGYSTQVMDSTTLEEANSEVGNWIRQRSRWCKGYYQTWLVHMRNPVRLLSQLGLKSFLSFNLVVGGAFVFLLNPIFWALTTIFILTQAGFIQQLFPGFVFYAAASMLFVGNFTFLYMNLAGALQRGYFGLAKYALLSPIYWGLMSLAAWKGAIQLVTKPFYWEKTVHGLDHHEASK
ncbi:MAG: glycosyltransferase [Solirubrobacteraceae bacterium]|nr:glycosyltransferase [Solirubrobacteraceae bacterium]